MPNMMRIKRAQRNELVSAMRLLLTGAWLLCVTGTALAFFEGDLRSGSRQRGFAQSRGQWLNAKYECGVRGSSTSTLIANGQDANIGEFPWHIGIYQTQASNQIEQICGGALISRTIVISAAHCFWDTSKGTLMPHTIYKIAAGKYMRDWNQRQTETQVRDVAEINVPRRYRGRQSNFQYDIVVVRLASAVDFNALVMPVCMDWTKRYEGVHLSVGGMGTAVGWGVTHHNVASNVLQTVDLPYIDFDTCFNALPEDAKLLFSADKFCAGFANQGRSVCQGDSGGGLTFSYRNRYYLRGVVSVSFKPAANRDPCYSQMYTGFTQVSQYLRWIKTFVDNEQARHVSVTQKPQTTTTSKGITSDKSPPRTVTQRPTKSQKMCKFYSSAVYDFVKLTSSASIKVSTCTMSPPGVTFERLISQPREFPHLAALGYLVMNSGPIQYKCNGNLISDRFVLTAARCLIFPSKWYKLQHVRLGAVSLTEVSTQPGLKIVDVERTYMHPQFDEKLAYNDVALLKLKETVSFNGYVRPACLDPSPSLLNQHMATVAGWGRASIGSEIYKNLLRGDVHTVDDDKCRKLWASPSSYNSKIPKGITPADMLCFNTLDTWTDCSLTSGSPLMVKLADPFCMYRIVGIVTYGQQNYCDGRKRFIPTVGMRISAFTPWIESIVWPTSGYSTRIGDDGNYDYDSEFNENHDDVVVNNDDENDEVNNDDENDDINIERDDDENDNTENNNDNNENEDDINNGNTNENNDENNNENCNENKEDSNNDQNTENKSKSNNGNCNENKEDSNNDQNTENKSKSNNGNSNENNDDINNGKNTENKDESNNDNSNEHKNNDDDNIKSNEDKNENDNINKDGAVDDIDNVNTVLPSRRPKPSFGAFMFPS